MPARTSGPNAGDAAGRSPALSQFPGAGAPSPSARRQEPPPPEGDQKRTRSGVAPPFSGLPDPPTAPAPVTSTRSGRCLRACRAFATARRLGGFLAAARSDADTLPLRFRSWSIALSTARRGRVEWGCIVLTFRCAFEPRPGSGTRPGLSSFSVGRLRRLRLVRLDERGLARLLHDGQPRRQRILPAGAARRQPLRFDGAVGPDGADDLGRHGAFPTRGHVGTARQRTGEQSIRRRAVSS